MDMSRLWARARTDRPVFSSNSFSRIYWLTKADIPATCGAAMEVPDIFSYWSLPPCTPSAVMCKPLTE